MTRIASRITLAAAAAALVFPASSFAQAFKVEKFNIGGEGGTDYLTADPASGRVYVSRGSHWMIVDGATGNVLGDIPDTPGTHGVALAPKWNHGFTTNRTDSTSTMFDMKTGAVIKKIHPGINGLDGIMYDEQNDKIVLINHSTPDGTLVIVDPKDGDVVGRVTLTGRAPEGGVADGRGRIYVNLEDKSAIDVVDTKTWKVVETWPIAPCEAPTGIAMDRSTNRIFSGCSGTSVVVDSKTGKVVAQIANGRGVDALGWDQAQKLMYIPAGNDGNVTVVHEDSPDRYTVVETVPTVPRAKTISVDETHHIAYLFTPEYGPPPAGATPPTGGRGRGPLGPMIAAWFIKVQR